MGVRVAAHPPTAVEVHHDWQRPQTVGGWTMRSDRRAPLTPGIVRSSISTGSFSTGPACMPASMLRASTTDRWEIGGPSATSVAMNAAVLGSRAGRAGA